ncbi:signal transduction histidine kinase [Paenarthrobacter nicotinovorans]|uniref:histidine kinase n=1 Tax=Paenarthrobacter nicotinovorans TaxID=29320 RepID=A0ABT9TLJ5_PAENI|nr:histidine kinase [Paenarthrobacter nicotinovorans]MDQ0102528.1 signal transduction histidine kinase [Paenarthrobacter nicotinovorans]
MSPRIQALRPAAAPLAGLGMLVALMVLEERSFDSASAVLVALTAAVAAAELVPVPAFVFAFAALGFQAFGIFPSVMLSGATPYVCLPVLFFFATLGWKEPQRWPLPVAAVTAAGLVTVNWFADTAWINFVFGKQLTEASPFRIAVYAFLVFASFSALNLAGWAAAASVRQAVANRMAKEQAESRLESTAGALVIEQERNRIARELHDVLAHSLAVITAQAEGIRYVHRTEPELVEEAANVIASSARSALQETRRLVQSFGSELEGPAPGTSELPALAERLESSGMPVELHTAGLEGLSPVEDLTVYRIVQESLTNAFKHGDREAGAVVTVAREPRGLRLKIRSRLADGGTELPPSGTGRGIPGMRERATAAGGRLTTVTNGQLFEVEAILP